MIKKIKRKFILVSLLAVSILLVSILSVVNIVNFSLVTKDADRVIDMIKTEENRFMEEGNPPIGNPNNDERPMGPSSPDMPGSMRFIKITFDKNGNVVEGVYKLAIVSEDEANTWAKDLLSSKSGWTRTNYRFQVYKNGNNKVVIIVDESRELLPSYRVLIASVVGTVVGLLASLVFLIIISKRFVKPIEESDAKQKKFISDAARELKTPVTIIALEEEVIKNKYGEDDSIKLIDKQLTKLNKLTKKMNELVILERIDVSEVSLSLSNILEDELGKTIDSFKEKNIAINSDISPDIKIIASEEIIRKMIGEVLNNGIKFARSIFDITLRKEGSRIMLEFSNDADDLKDGSLDLVFERFYKINEESSGNGLGLSFVKEVIKKYNGRISAKAVDGNFILKIEL